MATLSERSLVPDLSLVDVHGDLVWSRNGDLTLVYRLEAFHEPGLDGADFDGAALLAENCWSGLPEGTCYQFFVFVDQRRGIRRLEEALRPIRGDGPKEKLLEEFRQARLRELTRLEDDGAAATLVQDRRHYVAATFRPALPDASSWDSTLQRTRDAVRSWGRGARRKGRWETTYETLLEEAARFARRVEVGLSQMGLRFERCQTPEMVSFVYELLNPTASAFVEVDTLSDRNRQERDRLPRTIVEEIPYAADTSPVYSLLNDDLLVRRDHLRLGDRYVGVISLKELPDRTEPGILVPLLALNRERYVVYYRVDIPRAGAELAALRAKATLAAGLKLENFIVKSDRTDPQANAVEKQSDAAMERLISSTQRIFGTTLQIVLYEPSATALEEAVQETLGALSRAHGLRGYRETYLLREAYLALLPGAPSLVERRRKTLTPVMVDMLPIWGFQRGEGRIPFLTPHNGLVLYDPFDTGAQPNANILVTGTSGAGKSYAVSYLLSAYEVACAADGDKPPFTFILDNGASYRRYIELRPDGRYVAYSFEQPPGVQPFEWQEDEEALEEHISRLEWLLLDLLHVSDADLERFERKKAAIEAALYKVYRDGLDRDFRGFARASRGDPRRARPRHLALSLHGREVRQAIQAASRHEPGRRHPRRLLRLSAPHRASRLRGPGPPSVRLRDPPFRGAHEPPPPPDVPGVGRELGAPRRRRRRRGCLDGRPLPVQLRAHGPEGGHERHRALAGHRGLRALALRGRDRRQQQHEADRSTGWRVHRRAQGQPAAHRTAGRAGASLVAHAEVPRVPADPRRPDQRGARAGGSLQPLGLHDQREGSGPNRSARRGATRALLAGAGAAACRRGLMSAGGQRRRFGR